jgi:hypothetical protein
MSIDRGHYDAHLARIKRLVNVARLEMEHLQPTDYELRRAIRCDLADLMKELCAPSPLAVPDKRQIAVPSRGKPARVSGDSGDLARRRTDS